MEKWDPTGFATIRVRSSGPFKLNLFIYGLVDGPEKGCEGYDIECCHGMTREELELIE